MTLTPLRVRGRCFLDGHGREVILRGVNLGGDSKVPWPDGGTQHPSDFADHREVSFIGRPFPIEQADTHFARLAHWGFNCVRLLTTWEAVEHAGPRQYDAAYLVYFAEICRRAGAHGLYVFIDFHQDVWSRMSGGDGAPGWVFEALGLDFTRFHAAEAAHVMQRAHDYTSAERHQAAYPSMSWASNYRRPVNGILWTLFWAGRTVTPAFFVEGRNVQDTLQDHLLGAIDQVALRVKDMPHVIGFDGINEPGVGWLGQAVGPAPLAVGQKVPMPALPGLVWSPLQALAVARGLPTTLPVVGRGNDGDLAIVGTRQVNSGGVSIWREGQACPFERAGVYRVVDGVAETGDDRAFQRLGDRALSISDDAFGPFFEQVASTIRAHNPQWLLFAEMDPFGALAGRQMPSRMPGNWVNAGHWYDLTVLLTRHFDAAAHVDVLSGQVARGAAAVRERYVTQLTALMRVADRPDGEVPTLVGEFGIPFDLDDGQAYRAWAAGDRDDGMWARHTEALSLMYDAMDALNLSSTQWNYTASNHNDGRVGDGWNQEDLSIYSADQHDAAKGPDSGGRAIEGFCRPFARAVQGTLSGAQLDHASNEFQLEFVAADGIDMPTEVYVPARRYPGGYSVDWAGPVSRVMKDELAQVLRIWVDAPGPVRLSVTAP